MNVGQILTLTANKFPGRIAILFENQRFNHRMFNERVNRLSLALFHMGLSGAPWAKARGAPLRLRS